MNCYYCAKEPQAGGVNLTEMVASAICLSCGRALCERHTVKTDDGRPFSCPACAEIAKNRESAKPDTHGKVNYR